MSMLSRDDLLASEQRQQDTLSDPNYKHSVLNAYLERIGTDPKKQRTTLNRLNHSTAMTQQVFSDHQPGEESPIKGKGTIKWRIEDDNGVIQMIKVKKSLYILAFTNCSKRPLITTRRNMASMLLGSTTTQMDSQVEFKNKHRILSLRGRCNRLSSLCSSSRGR